MAGALAALLVVVAMAGLIVLVARAGSPAPSSGRHLPPRQRAALARAVAGARWMAGHEEEDGVTRVLLRRSCTGPDGMPMVLEERQFASFPSDDPLWEARFTEAMAQARYRCDYLNAEEAAG